MRLTQLNNIEIFLQVAKNKSFSASAKELGLSPSAISASIRKLEEHLNVPLIVRTTRSVALTDAGEQFYGMASSSFQNLESAFDVIKNFNTEPSGTFRITMPAIVFREYVLPEIKTFNEKYPKIKLECDLENRKVDIMGEGFDAGIRNREIIAQDMVGVKLSEKLRYICVASPSYIKKNGMPNKPQDLVNHNCLVPRVGKSVLYDHWEFEYRKKEFDVKVKGNLILNEIEGYLAATLEGLGIAYLPEHFLKEYLEKKLLVKCLENYECEGEGYYLYFPKSRQNEAKLRAFVDHFKFRNK